MYKRYASLCARRRLEATYLAAGVNATRSTEYVRNYRRRFFICCIENDDNELSALDTIHLFVEARSNDRILSGFFRPTRVYYSSAKRRRDLQPRRPVRSRCTDRVRTASGSGAGPGPVLRQRLRAGPHLQFPQGVPRVCSGSVHGSAGSRELVDAAAVVQGNHLGGE